MDAESNQAKGPRPREGTAKHVEGPDLESVIERAQGHDAEALGEIYRRFARRVFGLCRYMLNSRESAEDVTSEVFLKLQRAPSRATTDRYRFPGGCCGWPATTAWTLCGAGSVEPR
jgi:hypothetical protein